MENWKKGNFYTWNDMNFKTWVINTLMCTKCRQKRKKEQKCTLSAHKTLAIRKALNKKKHTSVELAPSNLWYTNIKF